MAWLPERHLAYFMLEAVRELDVSGIEDAIQNKDGRGTPTVPSTDDDGAALVRVLRGRFLIAQGRACDLRIVANGRGPETSHTGQAPARAERRHGSGGPPAAPHRASRATRENRLVADAIA